MHRATAILEWLEGNAVKPLAILVWAILVLPAPSGAALVTYNSDTPATNATTRASWLAGVGVGAPEHLVSFETGFFEGQNVHGVTGLFPAGLVIRDNNTNDCCEAFVTSSSGNLGASDPVGVFSLSHDEKDYLELDFSANPVDYVAFQDIDQSGTTGRVTFVGGVTENISFETTGISGNTAEFFGIYRNDRPRITKVELDASGDGEWGIDTIEYGVKPGSPSVPGLGVLGVALAASLLLGTGTLAQWRRSRDTHPTA